MRYAVIDKGLGLSVIQAEALKLNARNIKVAPRAGQIFCDLDDAAAERLRSIPGLAIKGVGVVRPTEYYIPPEYNQPLWGPEYEVCQPIYGSS